MPLLISYLPARWLCVWLCAAALFFRAASAQQLPPAGPQVINPEDTDPTYAARKRQQTQRRAAARLIKPTATTASALARPACFEAVDTSATGNAILLPRNDDGSFGPVALGWNFSLFGTTYNQVYINTNGNITFNSSYGVYSASGFPINVPMIAPFWADVDTRNAASGRVSYALYADRLVVTWNRVCYYTNSTPPTATSKNTFQLTIRANTAPTFTGNDITFAYDDMQWTTGTASSGSGGFGGVPATVGANRGNNVDFIQTGRFNLSSAQAPNSPGVGDPGGINFLDNQCLGYQVRAVGNVPPAVAGLPSNNTITVNQGQTQTVSLQFSGPETTQTVGVNATLNGLCNATAPVANNNTANPTVNFSVTGAACNVGTNTVAFTAVDSGTPAATATFTLTVVVNPPASLVWTGAVNTLYDLAGNWNTNTVPTATDDVTIPVVPNLPVVGAAGTARSVTINSGASLTLGPLGTFSLYGNLVSNGTCSGPGDLLTRGPAAQTLGGSGRIDLGSLWVGSSGATLATTMTVSQLLSLTGNLATTNNLTLLSTPTSTAFVVSNGGVATGNVTVQRAIDGTLNPGLGYHHYSSPVASATVGSLAATGFSPVLNASYNTSLTPSATVPFPTVYGYDQARVALANSSSPFDKGYFSPAATSDPLLVGRGYTINVAATHVMRFVGTLNDGDYTLSLTRNAASTPNAADAGWQLLGNPYPAPLDYSRVAAADRPNLEASIYLIQSTSQYGNQYRAYANGVGGNPVLPVGQGFFTRVQAGQTSGAITFRNSQRLTGTDNTTFQRTTPDARPRVELTLAGSTSLRDLLDVYFESGSTAGADAAYDACKLLNSTGLNLSSLTPQGEALAIDGRPLPTGQLAVPLQVRVPATGTYTLQASQLKNLSGLHVYLRDAQLGTLTDLSQQASYSFTLNAANLGARFELLFSPQPLAALAPAGLAQEIALYPSPAQGMVYIELPTRLGGQAVTATLVDALGRTVRARTLPAQGPAAHQLELGGLRSGAYTVRLATEAGVVAKRLLVE